MTTYALLLVALSGSLAGLAMYYGIGHACERRKAIAWKRTADALLISCRNRERELEKIIDGLKVSMVAQSVQVFQYSQESNAHRDDAARLAGVVRVYLGDMDKVSKALGDPEPPSVIADRNALRLHEELVQRTSQPIQSCNPSTSEAPKQN